MPKKCLGPQHAEASETEKPTDSYGWLTALGKGGDTLFLLQRIKYTKETAKGPKGVRFLKKIIVATREDSGVLGFPSRRGLTPRGSLECNPEIPAFPG